MNDIVLSMQIASIPNLGSLILRDIIAVVRVYSSIQHGTLSNNS